MKRIVAFLCLIALCLPFCSCSYELILKTETGTQTGAGTVGNLTLPPETPDEDEPIVYPDGFAVGYARTDVTPEHELPFYGGVGKGTHDPLLFTCTAVSDGTNVALLCSADLKGMPVKLFELITKQITKKFGIPADHVFLNTTHTHTAPDSSFSSGTEIYWQRRILSQSLVAVEKALRDLDLVEGAYIGTGYTDGITFVRRYLMPDGSYVTNPGGKVVAHETEADNEMRTIRIDRKNKKDVLMVSYQTHYGSASGLYPDQYSADFVHVFREEAEKKWDCHFIYYSGASGNLNFQSKISGERKYPTFVEATKKGFIPTVESCLAGEKSAEIGPLRFASSVVTAPVYQDTPEDIAKAKVVHALTKDTPEYNAALKANGFVSYREVEGIIKRSKLEKTEAVPFYAISFGDIGFASAPYEMFDTNGVEVREGSPFAMTVVCSCTNGAFGYVPSSIAFPHGGYEVFISRYCETTGDDFAKEMVRLLKECKNQG